jgi:hypothetical protein
MKSLRPESMVAVCCSLFGSSVLYMSMINLVNAETIHDADVCDSGFLIYISFVVADVV